VKEKIEAQHGMDASLMKLIAYGKVMEDNEKSLKEYAIKDGDFLVVMIAKVIITQWLIDHNRLSQHRSKGRMQSKKSHPRLLLIPNQWPISSPPHNLNNLQPLVHSHLSKSPRLQNW
jgi:hypothetical protein